MTDAPPSEAGRDAPHALPTTFAASPLILSVRFARAVGGLLEIIATLMARA